MTDSRFHCRLHTDAEINNGVPFLARLVLVHGEREQVVDGVMVYPAGDTSEFGDYEYAPRCQPGADDA